LTARITSTFLDSNMALTPSVTALIYSQIKFLRAELLHFCYNRRFSLGKTQSKVGSSYLFAVAGKKEISENLQHAVNVQGLQRQINIISFWGVLSKRIDSLEKKFGLA